MERLAQILRTRKWAVAGAALVVAAINVLAPVAILSLVRRPVDFVTWNPWLPRLPGYLLSGAPLGEKLATIAHLKLAWASADGADGVEWAFILDTAAAARIGATALLFGIYFALWSTRKARGAGVAGAFFGLTTGGCSLAGCGAPALPVVGLAFTGVSAGTLATFALISQAGAIIVLVLLAGAVVLKLRSARAPLSPVSAPAPTPPRA